MLSRSASRVRYHGLAMTGSFREFEVGPDPLGKMWRVRFLWLQTAVAIRHSDTVDVKFLLSNGTREVERIVALPHPDLVRLSERNGCLLTDPWCMKLAALHIVHMIETGEDVEKTLVPLTAEQLAARAAELGATSTVLPA